MQINIFLNESQEAIGDYLSALQPIHHHHLLEQKHSIICIDGVNALVIERFLHELLDEVLLEVVTRRAEEHCIDQIGLLLVFLELLKSNRFPGIALDWDDFVEENQIPLQLLEEQLLLRRHFREHFFSEKVNIIRIPSLQGQGEHPLHRLILPIRVDFIEEILDDHLLKETLDLRVDDASWRGEESNHV